MRIIAVTNITKLEAKNSQLRTGFLHKTDQQQLIEGTTREETCTLENCVNAELENNLGAQNRFEKMARISILLQLSWLRPHIYFALFFPTKRKELACVCLSMCVLYSGRSALHAETPYSRICNN